MEEKKFFQTQAGALTVAFIVTMVAFALIMVGIHHQNHALSSVGLIGVLGAMLFSPVKVFIIDRIRK